MTGERYQDLPPAKRRQLIVRAALRSVLVAPVLVVLYYALPLDRGWDSDTAVRLLAGVLVFAGLMVWHVRAIAGSRYPGLRAERASAGSFTQPLTRTDALYFTVTVFSTVGFGDITAKSEAARVVVIVQMLADIVLLGAGPAAP
jgi:voltage-gated potassium channel